MNQAIREPSLAAPKDTWRIVDLEIGFHAKPLISGLNCTFQLGDMVAVTGANGVGKSCLLKTLAGVQEAISGEIHAPVSFDYDDLGVVPQIAEIKPRFRISLYEMVRLGTAHCRKNISKDFIQEVISIVGLTEAKAKQSWQHSSGGERQRALIARALMRKPKVLLLDEATSQLDEEGTRALMTYLQSICQNEQALVVAVNHDDQLTTEFFPKRMHIKNARMELMGWPDA